MNFSMISCTFSRSIQRIGNFQKLHLRHHSVNLGKLRERIFFFFFLPQTDIRAQVVSFLSLEHKKPDKIPFIFVLVLLEP